MLFNSFEFLVFLTLVLGGHYVLIPRRHERARKMFLVLASYLFYMSWNPPFGLLLLFSTVLDFSLGQMIPRAASRRRRWLLVVSLLGNLGLLGFFKYGNFLLGNVYLAARPLGLIGDAPYLDVILPVGISFYTFQTLSYTIDVYRGRQAPTRSLLDFALYVSFFPQLVAGPIVRSRDFLPQLRDRSGPRQSDIEQGVMRIATGLLKKVVFADVLGEYVDAVFGTPGAYAGANVLLAIYAYAYQIYFDFSGYSDIAIGLGRLFGLRIPENFNRPYLAANPREFWRRWHISLSTWLRDYLYVPLGGNRRSTARTYVNLALTMLLGGLWHGAAWTFVLWGGYHGGLLMVHRWAGDRGLLERIRVPRIFLQAGMFQLVCVGWLLFRSQSVSHAWRLIGRLGVSGFLFDEKSMLALLLVAISAAVHILTSVKGPRRLILREPGWVQGLVYAGIAALIFVLAPGSERFIYFQF